MMVDYWKKRDMYDRRAMFVSLILVIVWVICLLGTIILLSKIECLQSSFEKTLFLSLGLACSVLYLIPFEILSQIIREKIYDRVVGDGLAVDVTIGTLDVIRDFFLEEE